MIPDYVRCMFVRVDLSDEMIKYYAIKALLDVSSALKLPVESTIFGVDVAVQPDSTADYIYTKFFRQRLSRPPAP